MEEKITRNFKGVWVPRELWLDKNLTSLEKTFMIEIDSLEDEKMGCFASNKHFMEMFDLTNGNVSRTITNLKNKGYIKINYDYSGKKIKTRHIFINRPPYIDKNNTYQNDSNGSYQNDNLVPIKMITGSYQNVDDSIPYSNTILDNNNIYSQVVDYLNGKTNKHYKSSTPKTKSLISARIKEGFTLEDFKKVIDTKCDEWLNDNKMCNYLRPETLFGTKFEGYLNQEKKNITTKDLSKKIDFMNILKE